MVVGRNNDDGENLLVVGKYIECGKIIVFIPRLAECSSQLSQAEKDREHWKLEYQLANIKLSKINNQVSLVEHNFHIYTSCGST